MKQVVRQEKIRTQQINNTNDNKIQETAIEKHIKGPNKNLEKHKSERKSSYCFLNLRLV